MLLTGLYNQHLSILITVMCKIFYKMGQEMYDCLKVSL